MPDIEDQLQRYGESLERHLTEAGIPVLEQDAAAERNPWTGAPVVAAAVLLFVLMATAAIAALLLDDGRVDVTTPDVPTLPESGGVFSTPTETVLLFSDGIDGVTAIDLDHRLAGRRVIEGERAGDQNFRLTLTDDHLIVGWGEIWAAPLTGGPSTLIKTDSVYIPASEPGEVWTVELAGSTDLDTTTISRVRVDGTATVPSTELNLNRNRIHPVIGVPGGLAFDTPEGVVVWDAATGSMGPVLGPGPVTAAASDGQHLAWCDQLCATTHVADLERTGPPTAPSVSAASSQIALSPDGQLLAVLRPTGDGSELVVTDLVTGVESTVATSLGEYGGVQWTGDGEQLFYTERPGDDRPSPDLLIGRYTPDDESWEIQKIVLGEPWAGGNAVLLRPEQATSFFNDDIVDPAECPGPELGYPSGREGVCTFAF